MKRLASDNRECLKLKYGSGTCMPLSPSLLLHGSLGGSIRAFYFMFQASSNSICFVSASLLFHQNMSLAPVPEEFKHLDPKIIEAAKILLKLHDEDKENITLLHTHDQSTISPASASTRSNHSSIQNKPWHHQQR